MKKFVQALLLIGFQLPQLGFAGNSTLESKVDYYSQQLLGRPYGSSPLGEGFGIDQDPLVRMDLFDCTTYVETAIALGLAGGVKADLIPMMNRLRYENGSVNFRSRNHFTNVDWVKNNAWLLKDVTRNLFPGDYETLETVISKSAWFAKAFNMSVNVADQRSLIFYVPFSRFSQDLLQRLPRVTVANVVRKDWNRKALLGTELDISHQGFLIRKAEGIYFRHASQARRETTELPLVEYLDSYHRNSSAVGLQILEFKK